MNLFRQDILADAVAGVVTALPFTIAGKDTVDESHRANLAAEYDRLSTDVATDIEQSARFGPRQRSQV